MAGNTNQKTSHSGNGSQKQSQGQRNRGSVRDAMTRNPIAMDTNDTVYAAACKMRDADVGDVLVTEGGSLKGIVTDRDIVIRAAAENKDLNATKLGQLCGDEVFTVAPDASMEDVRKLMEEKAIRRVPVVEGGKPVGIVSLGDLAIIDKDREALAEISSAPPNS